MEMEQTLDRRTRRTKAAIRGAFSELAEEKGLAKVTVSDIAERADINRKTFYHHYDSIGALIDEIVEDEAKRAANSIKEGMLDENGKIDVMQLFQALSVFIAQNAQRNGAVFANVDAEKFIRHFEPVLTRVASDYIPEVYGDAPKEQMRYLKTFVFSGLISTYHRWLSEGSEYDLTELAETVSVLIAEGLAGFREHTSAKQTMK
ncbi:MAG: TetR/AcrR family transcriptional regulator [Eggerthellaceae bacterium]|nr:TetR/AcrR family transcriptional regulator [Eggerthellaceae bacterium]